ncbi:MAG: ATP-binding protein [Anaerolineae bacterium]|nr:ATP-binding protein [Anaerolineae bacterium]
MTPSPPAPPLPAAGLEPPTVTVLDDDPAIRDLLQVRLQRSGYKVFSAGSYEEFITLMTDCDAVLCDIILADGNGLHALKWTRQHYPHTPVIMMTGEPTYETAAEAIRLGAYDYLAKPINKDELLSTLARAVEHRRLALTKARLEKENESYRLELEQRVAERTQALRESQEFLTNLTNTMADAVISIKLPEYRIEYVNQAVRHILGYEPEELLNQTLPILYPDKAGFEAFVQKQAMMRQAGKNQIRLEQLLRHKLDKLVWTEIATSFLEGEGQSAQIISVVRDISQRSLLLGVVAHELRGPLALLKGFSEVLLEDIQSIDLESLSKYLTSINSTVVRMFTLLNELLDVTSIELGQISLNLESVNLSQLLRAQASDYSYIANKKKIKLHEHLPAEDLICPCDWTKISQVISNFIDNAIKYSEPETTIELIGERRGANIWIGVKDQGPGIKPDEIQHLFKNFGKTSSRPTGGEKSTGLGLAICKKIVEAHFGEIGVDSNPGQGATFWFTLPLSPPQFSRSSYQGKSPLEKEVTA